MSGPDHIEKRARRLAADETGRRQLLTAPGCWDGFSALLIEQAGFDTAFVTGGGLSMARLGRPDMGLVTASEVAETVAAIRDRVAMALIVDADTGFGGALNVAHTVRRLERAGASAIQIEDQTFPKRCGHMAGKSVVSLVDSVGRIKAALDARVHALIVARTDAVAVTGLADALDRAEAFLHAGADVVFVEGPRTIHEASAVAQSLAARTPLVYNLVEGGTGVIRDGADLQALGYAIALHPLVLLHGLARAAPSWLNRLREERSTKDFDEELADLAIMNELTGAHDLIALSDRYET